MSAIRYVLAQAAEQGFFEAVIPASEPFDPFLRGAIRRGARRAFKNAAAATSVTDEAHVLRLAFLRLGTLGVPAPDDVAAVRQAFDAEKPRFPKRRGRAFWPVSFSVALAVLIAGGIVSLAVWFPSKRERFARSSLGQAMTDGLTDWTIGVGRADFDRQEKGRGEILTRGVKRQIGDGAFDLLGTALDQSKAMHAAALPEDVDREHRALEATLRALDGELQARKIPGFFDVYLDKGWSSNVWLLGFYVDDRATLTVGSSTVPMLRGHRLDNLNLEAGGTTYESSVLGGWIITLDELEAWIIEAVVPALGKGRGFAFGAMAAPQEGSAGRLSSKAGERMRAELLARMAVSEDDATELADLLSQRHSAFLRLAVLGDELFEPRGLAAKPRLRQALSRRKDLEMDAREITRIEDRLSRFDKSFDRLVAVQASVEEIRVAVLATCGKSPCKVTEEELASVNGAQLASHLTTVARSDATYTALAEAEIGPGGYATHWLIERELGLAPEWYAPYGVKDEVEHGQLGTAMFDKPADAIRKAAESAYAKVFGAPMPAVSRTQGW